MIYHNPTLVRTIDRQGTATPSRGEITVICIAIGEVVILSVVYRFVRTYMSISWFTRGRL